MIVRLQHLSRISDLSQPCIEDFSKCPEIISTPQTSKKSRKTDSSKSKADPMKSNFDPFFFIESLQYYFLQTFFIQYNEFCVLFNPSQKLTKSIVED